MVKKWVKFLFRVNRQSCIDFNDQFLEFVNIWQQYSKNMEQLNELKNLVMQNLEKNGYLSNIRAQIRSSVFKTIDSQESGGNKPSPFYAENAKVQKLVDDPKGVNCLMLIKDMLQTYQMENSLTVFSSESNQKGPAKRQVLALKNNVQAVDKEPLLYGIMTKFMKNSKVSKAQKPASSQVMQQKEEEEEVLPQRQNESEGEMEQVQEQIVRNNQSRRFGESEEFGQSQGYDVTVDSLKLEEYDYYEDIN